MRYLLIAIIGITTIAAVITAIVSKKYRKAMN